MAPHVLAPTPRGGRPQEVLDKPERTAFAFDPIEDALAAFSRGEFLVVMDDEDRENEGDLIIAASECSTEKMAWMIKHTRYVCPLRVQSPVIWSADFFFFYLCIQRVHLHWSAWGTAGGAEHFNDGSTKRGAA
jgi:hypothetical protein